MNSFGVSIEIFASFAPEKKDRGGKGLGLQIEKTQSSTLYTSNNTETANKQIRKKELIETLKERYMSQQERDTYLIPDAELIKRCLKHNSRSRLPDLITFIRCKAIVI